MNKWSLSADGLHILTQTNDGMWYIIATINYNKWMDKDNGYPMNKQKAKFYAKLICVAVNRFLRKVKNI